MSLIYTNNKDVKLLYQNLVDIALQKGQCVDQSKKQHLVFEVAIANFKDCVLFIAFSDLYLIVDIG